jgi:hypothetical protein
MFKLLTSSIIAVTTFAGNATIIVTKFNEPTCETELSSIIYNFSECLDNKKIDTCNSEEVILHKYSGSNCTGFYIEEVYPTNECLNGELFTCNYILDVIVPVIPSLTVKLFFEYFYITIYISLVINALFLIIVIIMLLCYHSKQRVVQDEPNVNV